MRMAMFAFLFLPLAVLAGEPSVKPGDLAAMQSLKQPPLLLDVRTPGEYRDGHIAGALNIPVDQVAARHGVLGAGHDREVIVYCKSGKRAARAQQTLQSLGYRNVRLLEGSMQTWQAEQRPVVREDAPADGNTKRSHD
jgi:phage shock protein E